MATTYLSKRWGDSETNPTADGMRSALAELDAHDSEHPDCWLSDESGWTIAMHEGGKVVLENVETGEGPWHLPSADRDIVLKLWLDLQGGDLGAIRKHDWQDGYGT